MAKRKEAPEKNLETTDSSRKKQKCKHDDDDSKVFSKEHFTNYLRWSIATAAESKQNWFGICEITKEGKEIHILDPTAWKKANCSSSIGQEIPAFYMQHLGLTLANCHKQLVQRRRTEPWWEHYYFIIDQVTGEFVHETDRNACAISVPARFMSEKARKDLVEQGKQTEVVIPTSNSTTFLRGTDVLLTVPHL